MPAVDASSWLLGLGLLVAIGLLVGVLPAMRSMRLNIVDALAGRSRGQYEESCHEEAQVVPGRRRPAAGGRRRHCSLSGSAVAVPALPTSAAGPGVCNTR